MPEIAVSRVDAVSSGGIILILLETAGLAVLDVRDSSREAVDVLRQSLGTRHGGFLLTRRGFSLQSLNEKFGNVEDYL